jgi:hypothetical protein
MKRVLVTFFNRDGWFVQFLQEDCKTSAGRPRNFRDPGKIVDIVRAAHGSLEDVQCVLHAIERGRGSVWVKLDDQQYEKLKQATRRR